MRLSAALLPLVVWSVVAPCGAQPVTGPVAAAQPLANPVSDPIAQPRPSLGRRAGHGLVANVLSGLNQDVRDVGQILGALADNLKAIKPTATPTSPVQAMQTIKGIFATPRLYVDSIASLIENGLNTSHLVETMFAESPQANSYNNTNLAQPRIPVYARKISGDAPYSVLEKDLRGALYMPSGFTYGKKPPVILFPPTGVDGGRSFAATYARLLAQKEFADPVWVNVPGHSLADAQVTAEYAAYAINYVAGITGRNISIVTFSQGSVNVQWALKYWPSTRLVTSNFIPLSGDFNGTVEEPLLCPAFPNVGCTPSLMQQQAGSNFLQTLRRDGGDSAYVPTTSIFSVTDEVVQPQNQENGSGRLEDGRGVGVLNVEVQKACGLHPAGLVYTHEGILYNPLAWALTLDVLSHGGPGNLSRIDMTTVCSKIMPSGMGLQELLEVEGLAVALVLNFLAYQPRIYTEPAVAAYAKRKPL